MAPRDKGREQEKASASRRAPQQQAQAASEHERPLNPSPARALKRAASVPPSALRPADIKALQHTVGNRAVVRLLGQQPRSAPPQPSAPAQAVQLKAELEEAPRAESRVMGGAPNRTGLPDNLRAGVESLSGMSLDDVKVHYNSPRPAEVQALAYTQGTDIHLAPGEEGHLAHEAWHVVQQKQGRVKPTLQAKGLPINDDAGLEREADVMGQMALSGAVSVAQRKEFGASYSSQPGSGLIQCTPAAKVIQRAPTMTLPPLDPKYIKPWAQGDWDVKGWRVKTLHPEYAEHFTDRHVRDDVEDATAKAALKSRVKTVSVNTIYKKADLATAADTLKKTYYLKTGQTRDVQVTLTDVPNKKGRWRQAAGARSAADETALAEDANYTADAELTTSTLTARIADGGMVKLFHV